MENSKTVHTTKDYHLFSPIDGNRNKNLLHVNKLKKSMSEHYLFTVIIVNENYEIIDGQHRFDVIKELNLELNYIVCKNYGLNEVHILNQNSKTWNADDYLTGYCNLGYDDYIKYENFKNKYKIGHNEARVLLGGMITKQNIEVFYKGDFKIKSLKKAEEMMDKILLIKPYYEGAKRRSFIYAMITILKNEQFVFSEFLKKLKYQSTVLQDCTTTGQYKALIEDIYNYKRREKVNLRY